MAYKPIHPCFLGHETPEKTMPNHGTPIVLWPNEVLTFSISTFYGIEIEMLQIFAQRMIWMKTVILKILQMNVRWTLNGLSIISTTNCIAASRLHTINFFTWLETPLTASFGQDHYEKSRKFVNMLTVKKLMSFSYSYNDVRKSRKLFENKHPTKFESHRRKIFTVRPSLCICSHRSWLTRIFDIPHKVWFAI